MSGHNKWANIKRRKGAQDAKKAQVFTKLAKMITVAAREGGADPEMNFKLKLAVDKARQANMPADNVNRAIERGAGGGKDGVQIEEATYEVFGPNGIAAIVTVVTDNKNRALSDLKLVFSRHGGSMGGSGTVAWMFDKVGLVLADTASIKDFDDLTLSAIDHGLSDVEKDDELTALYCRPVDLKKLRDFLATNQINIDSAELIYKPKEVVKVDGENERSKVEEFLEALDELDDVERVDSNYQ